MRCAIPAKANICRREFENVFERVEISNACDIECVAYADVPESTAYADVPGSTENEKADNC